MAIPCAQVVDEVYERGSGWLLLAEVLGEDLVSAQSSPVEKVTVMATALRPLV